MDFFRNQVYRRAAEVTARLCGENPNLDKNDFLSDKFFDPFSMNPWVHSQSKVC